MLTGPPLHQIQDAYNFVEAVRKLAQASHREKATMQASLVQEYGDEAAKKGAEETQLSIKNGYMCMVRYRFIFELRLLSWTRLLTSKSYRPIRSS